MQRYFRVTQPTVHKMLRALERRGAVSRVPGTARSIRVLVSPDDLPALEERPFEYETARGLPTAGGIVLEKPA